MPAWWTDTTPLRAAASPADECMSLYLRQHVSVTNQAETRHCEQSLTVANYCCNHSTAPGLLYVLPCAGLCICQGG